jgi:hypothetical protein
MPVDVLTALARTPAQREALARKYAPIVYMHPDDPWMPMDPATFIRACELRFETHGEVTASWDAGSLSAEQLGRGSGFEAYGALAEEIEGTIRAWAFTRPFTKGGWRDETGLNEASGFSLRRDSDPVQPPRSEAPMFYEWRGPARLVYWFFMPGSALPKHVLRAILEAIGRALDAVSEGAVARDDVLAGLARDELLQLQADIEGIDLTREVHQGDWEGVTYGFAGDEPRTVELHQHADTVTVPFRQLEAVGDRAKLYSALRSHATVGSLEDAGAEAVSAAGEPWRPGADLIRDAMLEPWYGFGGAWGQTRLPPIGAHDARTRAIVSRVGFDIWEEATGPLGPSPFKDH